MSAPLTVVTVAFGCPEVVRKWYASWRKFGCRCIICDNGGDLPADIAGDVQILPYQGNKGFGIGINRAVMEADSPLVLITNPDTHPVDSSSIESLVSTFRRGTLATGLTVDENGIEIPSTGIWPTYRWVKQQIFKSAETLWRSDRTDWIQGSMILASRDELLELGGFSASYPLYFEDVDLCCRATLAGLSVVQNRDARFVHQEGTGSSGSSQVRLASYHWGLVQFFKDHNTSCYQAVRKLVMLKCLIRAVGFTLLKPSSSSGYYRGLMAVLRDKPPILPERSNG